MFPAYWQYEPSALTVARRQYQHMKEGMDEKTAYEKAVKYVDDKENDCYVDLLELKKKLEDSEAVKSFVSDPSSLRFISYWREKLAKTKYSELELADQGEIDHFVQTKVLKWNEVERERRMKDPMFFMNFEDVRSEIFPDISKTVRMMEPGIPDDMQGFKRGVSDMYNEKNVSLWRTSAPFYYEGQTTLFRLVPMASKPS